MSNPTEALALGKKYCDVLFIVSCGCYEKAQTWEKGNTHCCCHGENEGPVVLQVRMKLGVFLEDYDNETCLHCYETKEELFEDYPEFSGSIFSFDEFGNPIEEPIFKPTIWGD